MGGAVGGESCPGSSQWTFSPKEVCTTLQPGTLGRNCASEKVYLLWDRRRKLFSRRLGLVGRKTKQKKPQKSECEGRTRLYYFKGQAEQLGSDWDTGKEMVGKNR